jgi:hypothetical protein
MVRSIGVAFVLLVLPFSLPHPLSILVCPLSGSHRMSPLYMLYLVLFLYGPATPHHTREGRNLFPTLTHLG